MDAKDFINEANRMYQSYPKCSTVCPLFRLEKGCSVTNLTNEWVDIVKEWSKGHPVITNQQKFYEVFGRYDIESLDWWQKNIKNQSEKNDGNLHQNIKNT